LLRPNFPRAILSLAAHLSALVSVMIACAYTCKAVALPYAFGAVAGAVFYLVLVAIVWE
jgi:zinc transporter ZupT